MQLITILCLQDLCCMWSCVCFLPVNREVLKAEYVEQADGSPHCFELQGRRLINGCIDFLNNPHKQASIYALWDTQLVRRGYQREWTGSGVQMRAGDGFTFTKASRTSSACSMLRGVDTVSPRVIIVRLVKQFIRSFKSTYEHRTKKSIQHY